MFRLVKQYNLPKQDLIQIYIGYIRQIMEYCAPVFNGALTVKQNESLEKIQKKVLRIILGINYVDYDNALLLCKLERLEIRRKNLCLDFAKSLLKNPHCKDWIPERKNISISLRCTPKYAQFNCKTVRFQKSAIPYFISLLNQ